MDTDLEIFVPMHGQFAQIFKASAAFQQPGAELMQRWLVCIIAKCVRDSLNLGFAITTGKLTSLLLKVILLGIITMARLMQ